MTELRGILIRESQHARLFEIADRQLWIPRSITHSITKFKPDANGHSECRLTVEDWFAEKEDL